MKNINFKALLLAILVVFMFCLVGVAIYYTNFLLMALFFIAGSAIMVCGLIMKNKQII
ncbi:MAG TPA: DUF5325 family protein [Pseudogracilibacillus sp.]|nr:DUF5325 family protein [Pseudogracilibacillus sp.]